MKPISDKINEILSNMLYWDTCPDGYKQIIREFLSLEKCFAIIAVGEKPLSGIDVSGLDYEDKLSAWISYYESKNLEFADCDNKFNDAEQVSAIMFLASKLKDKKEVLFLHGEHDVLYIGSDYDVFEEFTEEDIRTAVYHGLSISDDGGFLMYASM